MDQVDENTWDEEELSEIEREYEAEESLGKKPRRRIWRVFFGVICALLIVALLLGGCVGFYWFYSQSHFETSFYQETSDLVVENLRIVFLSDLHNREYGEGNSRLLEEIGNLAPDLILVGGDMISRDDEDDSPMLALFTKLSGIAPLYGVLGNHELERMYPSDPAVEKDELLAVRFQEAGLHLLRNDTVTLNIGQNTVQLVGIEGTEAGVDLYGAREKLNKMEFHKNAYCVMLTHIPILFREKLSMYPFELGLAGHTHGGLVRLPGVGGIYSAEEGFFPTYSGGSYALDNGAMLVISRGLGDSGSSRNPRVNNIPELVVIDVNWC